MTKHRVRGRQYQKLFPRKGDAEAELLNIHALSQVGVSINGAPAVLAEGDVQVTYLRLLCPCGTGVGGVTHVARGHRGENDLWFVSAQLVEDHHSTPPTVGIYRRYLEATDDFPMECPVHDRYVVPGTVLMGKLTSPSTRVRITQGKTAVLMVGDWRVSPRP